MQTLVHPDQVRAAINGCVESHGPIVVHGTARQVSVGDCISPQVCTRASTDMRGEAIDWSKLPPYVFAAMPEHADFAIFMATVLVDTLPYTAGVRDESANPDASDLVYMADANVKARAMASNRLATFCLLSAGTFERSPNGSWAERVSESSVRVLGAYGVRYSALSFSLNDIPPLYIPGVSAEELGSLAAAAREARA